MLISAFLSAVLIATPTVDAFEPLLAARDAANDRAWTELKDPAAFAAKRDAFRETFRRKIGFYAAGLRGFPCVRSPALADLDAAVRMMRTKGEVTE